MYRTLISSAALEGLRNETGALSVFDCRFSLADPAAGRRAYEAGHIPGATYAHLERNLSGEVIAGKTGRHPLPEPKELAQWLGQHGVDEGTQVVCYDDQNGAIAARLWWLLRWLGHEAVAVLDGGYAEWSRRGYPATSEKPAITPKTLPVRLKPELVVTAEQVDELRERSDHRLFDARGASRYRGEEEPIDPVAGHIPGARSLPFEENTREGLFAEPSELSERYTRALDGVAAHRAIVYCGSGVTACHDILAAEHGGHPGMRLYAGSWSEWIANGSRPVARDA